MTNGAGPAEAVRGFLYHAQLTLRLNFAARQPLVYGFLVPIFFLIAFGTVFREGTQPLLHQMGQVVTISAIGGACFGLPTALVAERERGWWRRYRLLPRALAPLVASTLLARFVLIASAAGMQILLARLIYGTPLPANPIHLAVAFAGAAFAFMGMGLVLAAFAEDVPAVQALGQCVFLPLIMIGGVGVPLIALPDWTQRVAAFLPGRYAVDALSAGFTDDGRGPLFRFNVLALLAMGLGAGIAGARLFRWDCGRRPGGAGRAWVVAALLPWAGAGLLALGTERWHALATAPADPSLGITEAQMAAIAYDGLPPDDGTVTPLAPARRGPAPEGRARLDELMSRLGSWPRAHDRNPSQAIRYLLCVAAVADVDEDPQEGQIARAVLNYLGAHFPEDQLERGLAWVILVPDGGSVVTAVPELAIRGDFGASTIRRRDRIYAMKFLGRHRGRINP